MTIATAISRIAETPYIAPRRSIAGVSRCCGSWLLTISTPPLTSAKPTSCNAFNRSSRNTNDSTMTNGL